MTTTTHGADSTDVGPVATGLTDAEKFAALGTYVKVLTGIEKDLRSAVTKGMGDRHEEKIGAYLPDGTKMASVSLNEGRRSARVTDPGAALAWCLKQYPEEVQTVQVVRPAFLKKLLDVAGSLPVGKGLDPATGEELPFIEVARGDPFVSITTTKEGFERMSGLAHGFTGMLEGPKPGPGQGAMYDPAFADRMDNGAYDR